MPRLRVVHLLLTMDVGGLERVAMDIARLADPERFDVRILCLRSPGELAPVARALGVNVEALEARGGYRGLFRLVRRLRLLRPAVLHTHNPGPHRIGVVARALAGVPVLVHTKHGRNFPHDRRAVAINHLLSRFTDTIVAVSDDAAWVALDVERVSPAKVQVIHNGVEPGEPPPPQGWGPWQPRAITVARLDPIKDQPTLLRAARLVVDTCPDFRLDVVGDGPDRASLERLANDLGLREHVSFLGYRADVRSLLKRPQLFVLSSVSEGIALTLLEAMAAGLPVIATDVGGNREVVAQGVSGLLVPPRSPEALAQAMLGLARDPARVLELGRAGRRRLEEEFDLRHTVRRYQELYVDLVARSGHAA